MRKKNSTMGDKVRQRGHLAKPKRTTLCLQIILKIGGWHYKQTNKQRRQRTIPNKTIILILIIIIKLNLKKSHTFHVIIMFTYSNIRSNVDFPLSPSCKTRLGVNMWSREKKTHSQLAKETKQQTMKLLFLYSKIVRKKYRPVKWENVWNIPYL